MKKEIGPIALNENWAIAKAPISINQNADDQYGVKITEFHQVKSAANGKITFYEPIMHDIDIKYNDTEGWEIRTYKYLENVGVEDLSFVGNALDGYAHHGEGHAEQAKVGWQYDGAYKPLLLQRVVNSWVRNVHFESVSEAPNHLSDLTLWNLNVTGTDSHASNFEWWSDSDKWWKIFPPIVVGVHGTKVQFAGTDRQQVTYEESTGAKVSPESLYEAQLRERLGYVPGWLNALK